MIYYGHNDWRDYRRRRFAGLNKGFLAHHGIKGQRKGERNGPPYPLSPEAHSKSEIKAGWETSIKPKKKKKKHEDWSKYDLKRKGSIFHIKRW